MLATVLLVGHARALVVNYRWELVAIALLSMTPVASDGDAGNISSRTHENEEDG